MKKDTTPYVMTWRLAVGAERQRNGDLLAHAAADFGVSLSTVKAVALWLSTWMNVQGYTFVGTAAVADRASMSRRHVQRALDALEAAGFIDVTPGGGRGRTPETFAEIPENAAWWRPLLQESKRDGDGVKSDGDDAKGGAASRNGDGATHEVVSEVVTEIERTRQAANEKKLRDSARRPSPRPSRAEMESWYEVG